MGFRLKLRAPNREVFLYLLAEILVGTRIYVHNEERLLISTEQLSPQLQHVVTQTGTTITEEDQFDGS